MKYLFVIIVALCSGIMVSCDRDISIGNDGGPFIEAGCPGGCGIQTYDSDGDCISDALELNLTNDIHNFNVNSCDVNPSEAVGAPNNSTGSLTGGINLRDIEEGYYHFLGTDVTDTDDWGTLALCSCIEATGRDWGNAPPRMGSGDMSLQNGGYFSPHGSHRNGRDVDVRYVRNDESEESLDLSIPSSYEDYDEDLTFSLFVMYILNCNVTDIFVETEFIGFTNEELTSVLQFHDEDIENEGWVKYSDGHSNHFHVRIADPD